MTSEGQHTKTETGLKKPCSSLKCIGDQKRRKGSNALQPIETKEDLLLGSPVVSNHFCLAHISDMIKFISSFRDTFPFGSPMLFSSKFE